MPDDGMEYVGSSGGASYSGSGVNVEEHVWVCVSAAARHLGISSASALGVSQYRACT